MITSGSVLEAKRNRSGAMRVYGTEDSAIWAEILGQIGNFDFYHTVDYHALEEARLGGRSELIVYSEGDALVALPLVFSEIDVARDCAKSGPLFTTKSVYGYVGWLATDETTLPILGRFGRRIEGYLRDRGVVSLFSRMHPLLPRQNNELGVGRIENVGKTVAINLREGLAAYEAGISRGHRYEIRKLKESGCEIHCDCGFRSLSDFHRLYSETMKKLNAPAGYFYSLGYLEYLTKSRSFETRIFKAVYRDQICAMAMFIKCGRIVQYHLSCSQDGVVRFPATKLLIDEACRWGFAAGCDWIHLGGGLGAQQDTLFQFKAGFGGIHVPFNVWKCIFRDGDYADLCDAAGHREDDATSYFPAFLAVRP